MSERNSEALRIAVIGCGAMGSVYAARLARGGHDVLVVDGWADHIHAIEREGLHVVGPDGEFTAPVRACTSVPNEVVDLVILAVKAADVAAAAASINDLVGPGTLVLTIQNGLGMADSVAEIAGADRLIVGIAKGFGASLTGPGRAHHNAMRALRFGAYAALDPQKVEMVAAAWRRGGFDCEAVADIAAMQWEKLICNVAYSAPCALTGMTVGEVLADPDLGPVSRAAAVEAWKVAKARGVAVQVDEPEDFVREFGARMPDAKPSALLDIEAGRVSEVAFINGAVPDQAGKAGMTAPVNETLAALVRVREKAFARGRGR